MFQPFAGGRIFLEETMEVLKCSGMSIFVGGVQVYLCVAVLEQTMLPKEDVYKRPANQICVVIVYNDFFV